MITARIDRWAPLALTAILVLSACAGAADQAASTTATTASTTSTTIRAETTTTVAATRPVDHALGTTEIPTSPERIVVLNPYVMLDALLAVGVTPVGSTGDPVADHPFAAWQPLELVEGIEMVGFTGEEDLEKIAVLQPHLILANPWQEDTYDELSGIAPTVAVPLSYQDYETEFRYLADLVGKGTEAEEVIDAHHRRIDQLRTRLGDPAEITVSVVRVFPDSILVGGGGYIYQLLDAIGLSRPQGQQGPDQVELSLEQLAEVDGDVILVYSAANAALEADNAAARDSLLEHPLWQQLSAAQAGKVFVVDSFLWGGGGILWADAMLADLERILLEEGAGG